MGVYFYQHQKINAWEECNFGTQMEFSVLRWEFCLISIILQLSLNGSINHWRMVQREIKSVGGFFTNTHHYMYSFSFDSCSIFKLNMEISHFIHMGEILSPTWDIIPIFRDGRYLQNSEWEKNPVNGNQ